jgi:hypothetical protein
MEELKKKNISSWKRIDSDKSSQQKSDSEGRKSGCKKSVAFKSQSQRDI